MALDYDSRSLSSRKEMERPDDDVNVSILSVLPEDTFVGDVEASFNRSTASSDYVTEAPFDSVYNRRIWWFIAFFRKITPQ
jgi:hypothetical protein